MANTHPAHTRANTPYSGACILFESMLASSEYDFYSASEGLDADLDLI
jgi:hypothetical protein